MRADTRLTDYLEEAKASLDYHYEEPDTPEQPQDRLLESIAESLIAIAEALTTIAREKT